MAKRYFRPGTSTAPRIDQTTFWAATPDGATGASVPVNADEAYFYEGNVEISATGITALAAVNLENCEIGPLCGLRTPPGASLQLQVSNSATSTLKYEGHGAQFSIECMTNVDFCELRPSGGVLYMSGSGVVAQFHVFAGQVVVTGSLNPTAAYLAGASASLRLEDGTAWTLLEVLAGTAVARRSLVRVRQSGGNFTIHDQKGVTTEYEQYGGACRWSSGGTCALYTGRGGSLTPRGAPTNPTFTNTTLIGSSDNLAFYSKYKNIEIQFTNAPVYTGEVMLRDDSLGLTP